MHVILGGCEVGNSDRGIKEKTLRFDVRQEPRVRKRMALTESLLLAKMVILMACVLLGPQL